MGFVFLVFSVEGVRVQFPTKALSTIGVWVPLIIRSKCIAIKLQDDKIQVQSPGIDADIVI